MDTLKEVAAKVGDKVSHATETESSKPSTGEDAHQTSKQFNESDKVDTAGRPDITDIYGTHPQEKASSLVSNLEKLGNKPSES